MKKQNRKETKHEFEDLRSFIALYICTTIVAFGIVLAFCPDKFSALRALYFVAIYLCGSIAMILITEYYSKYAKLPFRSYPKTGWSELLGVVFILILFVFSIQLGVPFVMKHLNLFSLPKVQIGFFFSLFKFIFAIAIALLFTWGWKRSFKDIGISRQNIGKGVLLALILCPISMLLFFSLGEVFSAAYPIEKLAFRIPTEAILTSFLYAIGLCLMDPGVVEELIFRGLTQNKMERCMDWRLAILLTSILFGLFHLPMSYLSVPLTIPFGLLMGYIYHRTQNLIITILIHGLSAGVLSFIFAHLL